MLSPCSSPFIHVRACLPVPLPAEEVWRRIGGFDALADWHPGALSSPLLAGDPTMRRVTLPDGSDLLERCTHRDDAARTYGYTLVSGPLPVTGYQATLGVRETGAFDCRIDWQASFRPAGDCPDGGVALSDLIGGIFTAGLCGAAALLARR